MKTVRDQLLAVAMPAMERVVAQMPVTEQSEPTLLALKNQLAAVKQEMGQPDAAEALIEECLAMARRRVDLMKESDAARNNLAVMLQVKARFKESFRRDLASSLALMREAGDIAQDMLDRPRAAADGKGLQPRYVKKFLTIDMIQNQGVLHYRLGDHAAALAMFERNLGENRRHLEALAQDPDFLKLKPEEQARLRRVAEGSLSRSILAVGSTLQDLGRYREAEPHFRAALANREKALERDPAARIARRELAAFAGMWGEFLEADGRSAEAGEQYRRSVGLFERLLREDADNAEVQRAAALAYHRLGAWLEPTQPAAARKAYEQDVELREELLRRDPKNEKKRKDLMIDLPLVGQVDRAAKLAEEFRKGPAVDHELRKDLSKTYSNCAANAADAAAKEQFAALSVAVLAEAVRNGYRDAVYLRKKLDKGPLKDRADLKSLLDSLPSAPPPKK
jgi:tetratricopeptide (TPR) repeat protein